MSDSEAFRLRDGSLSGLARSYELTDPPHIDLVRWTTVFDHGETMAACLRDAGFNAVGAGTMIEYPDGIGPSQQTAFQLADYECTAKYTLHPKFTQPYTEEQFGLLYDYWTEWLVPCLNELGIESVSAPTRETFVARAVQGSLAWDPFGAAEASFSSSPEKNVELRDRCPAYPAVEHMWG